MTDDPDSQNDFPAKKETGSIGRLIGLISTILLIAAPFVIYYLYVKYGYRAAFLSVIGFLFVSRIQLLLKHRHIAITILAQFGAISLYFLIGWLYPHPLFIKLLSAFINTVLMIAFAYSLIRPPSIIESFARMQVKDLPEEAVVYCRTVTWVWIGFFFLDSLLVIYISLVGTMFHWLILTGVINYIFVGMIFGGEWLYRRRRFGKKIG